MASWLDQVMGPSPAPRVVSMTRNSGGNAPQFPEQAGGGSPTLQYDIQSLLKNLQGSFDKSNAAGQEQYQNLLSAVGGTGDKVSGLYKQAGDMTANFGNTARQEIDTGRVQQLGTSEQDLMSRGLGNTTIRSSVRRGINSDAQRNRASVDEMVNRQRAGLMTQQAGAEMGMGQMLGDAILSKQNIGPEAGMYAQLIESLTRAGGSQGEAGGSGGGYSGSGGGGGFGAGVGGGSGGGGGGFGSGGGSAAPGMAGVYSASNPSGNNATSDGWSNWNLSSPNFTRMNANRSDYDIESMSRPGYQGRKYRYRRKGS